MTREEAKMKFITLNPSVRFILIDEIYDDFESRICRNCKWFVKDIYGIYCELAAGEDRCLQILENFGCNRFERKNK